MGEFFLKYEKYLYLYSCIDLTLSDLNILFFFISHKNMRIGLVLVLGKFFICLEQLINIAFTANNNCFTISSNNPFRICQLI